MSGTRKIKGCKAHYKTGLDPFTYHIFIGGRCVASVQRVQARGCAMFNRWRLHGLLFPTLRDAAQSLELT